MKTPKIININGKNVYATSSSKTIKPTHHHLCPSCNCPIYDRKPVCGVCFEAGKFPKRMWKSNQTSESSPHQRSSKLRTNSRRKGK